LSGWRDEGDLSPDDRIETAMAGADLTTEMPIVTGYLQCADGLMREYDRGYSEVTFSWLTALTGAREAIIHMESLLSSADPNLVGADAVRKLGRTNYDVADQLSNLGVEAVHPKAAKTLRQAEVPLHVTNAFEPHDPGTLIDDQPADSAAAEIVTGLSVLGRSLQAIAAAGLDAIGASQGPRNVDVRFTLERDNLTPAIVVAPGARRGWGGTQTGAVPSRVTRAPRDFRRQRRHTASRVRPLEAPHTIPKPPFPASRTTDPKCTSARKPGRSAAFKAGAAISRRPICRCGS